MGREILVSALALDLSFSLFGVFVQFPALTSGLYRADVLPAVTVTF